MRRLALAFAVLVVVGGMVSPSLAQDADNDTVEQPDNETDLNETDGETGEEENETRGPPEDVPGESAQFDARLMTAIDTLDTLVDIAPNDEARQDLETALETLREVQENTDTASLGPEETPEEENESSGAANTDAQQSQRQGPPESAGPSGDRGPSSDRGPSDNGNRPGFVNQMLGELFG